jgi:hypothetical protein
VSIGQVIRYLVKAKDDVDLIPVSVRHEQVYNPGPVVGHAEGKAGAVPQRKQLRLLTREGLPERLNGDARHLTKLKGKRRHDRPGAHRRHQSRAARLRSWSMRTAINKMAPRTRYW